MKCTYCALALCSIVSIVFYPTFCCAEDVLVARNQLIVEWNPSAAISSNSGAIGGYDIEPSSTQPISPISNATLVEVDDYNHIGPLRSSTEPVRSSREAAVCQQLISSGIARACSPNYYLRTFAIPNDVHLTQDYWHHAIGSYDAWDVRTSSEEVVVGVVDSGINYNHPDLVDNMWRNSAEIPGNGIDDDSNGVIDDVFGLNTINDSGDPMDDNVHGSHCAGIIGARGNNGQGVAGVGWRAKLMALKFISADGWGWTMDAIQAIDYAVMMKQRGVPIRVLSNSWGGGGFSKLLEDSIRRAHDAGILFVAAAGNSGSDNDILPSYPANHDLPNVISVAASEEGDQLAAFSCFGANSVHIAAPGSMIKSTGLRSEYVTLSGTSMATPFVSGALALLLAQEPGLSVAQAIQRLYQSAAPKPELEGVLASGRLLNVNNLIRGIHIPDPEPGLTCSYGLEEIPYDDSLGRNSAPLVIPDNYGWGANYHVPLLFEFPFFTSSFSSMYVGVNGIVYFEEPQQPWYLSFLPYAPINSIAALHTGFFTWSMPAAPLGVRVSSSPERVSIRWELPQQWNPTAGTVVTTLTLFENGTMEIHSDIPNDRLAATLLYGSLVGMRGSNVANSLTVSKNGIPNLLRGRKGYRITRPTACMVERRVVGPTPTPTATPIPMPTPYPTYPAPDGPFPEAEGQRPTVLSLGLRGTSSGKITTGGALTLSITTSKAMVVPLSIWLDNYRCRGAVSISTAGGAHEVTTQLPVLPHKPRRITVGYQGLKAVARVSGRGLVRPARAARACSLVTEALRTN